MSKVVKFGGSSLASAEQFKKVGNIIRADKERKYVVPSAPGKRFSDDTKVTDRNHELHYATSSTSFHEFIYFIELTHTAAVAEGDD